MRRTQALSAVPEACAYSTIHTTPTRQVQVQRHVYPSALLRRGGAAHINCGGPRFHMITHASGSGGPKKALKRVCSRPSLRLVIGSTGGRW